MKNIIFIDVDGTLTHGKSSWERVHHYFEKYDPDMVKKMDANTARWEAKEIDYEEWARLDVALWSGYPISDLEKALLPPNLINNAANAISKLKNNGFYVVLVSGGINVMVDKVREMVGADESYSNIIQEENGIINGNVYVPVHTKVDVVMQVMKKLNIDKSKSYAIGDHLNDIEMFKHVNYSIGINIQRDELRQYVNEVIHTNDFMDIADAILKI